METPEIFKALEQYASDPEVDGFYVPTIALMELIMYNNPDVDTLLKAYDWLVQQGRDYKHTIFGKKLFANPYLADNQFQICKTYPYAREKK